jgi:hypothetical protein
VFALPGPKPPLMELRPLGFGEIFDRAVTLYIRNFVPFVAIVAVLVVPTAIVQYLLDLASQPEFDAYFRILTAPGTFRTQPVPTIFTSPSGVIAFVVLLVLTYAVWPFALNAVAVGVARLYRSRPVEFRPCYAVVLERWLPILGIMGLSFLVFLGWYVSAILVAVIFALIIAAFIAAVGTAGFFLGFIGGALAVLLLFPSLAPLLVALTFSMYGVVIEERPIMDSLALGFARVFNRAEFWRALLFAVAVGAVVVAGSTIFSIVGVIAAFAHLALLQAAIESLSRAVITPFAVVLLAIYYFDVRIRREGLDLETSIERLTAAEPA